MKEKYPEIIPGRKRFKVGHAKTMMAIVGRGFQAAARVDPDVIREVAELPDGFSFGMLVRPSGPRMTMQKDSQGRMRYRGDKLPLEKLDVLIRFKNVETAGRVFNFEVLNAEGYAQDCVVASGDVPQVMAVLRCLDIVQVYLLPKFMVMKAIRRYPQWTFKRIHLNRLRIYGRMLVGA